MNILIYPLLIKSLTYWISNCTYDDYFQTYDYFDWQLFLPKNKFSDPTDIIIISLWAIQRENDGGDVAWS